MNERAQPHASTSQTKRLVLYTAVCKSCGGSPDSDGEEYVSTPAKAIEFALKYHDWTWDDGDLLCNNCGENSE